MVGRKKVRRYSEGQCDAVLQRLQDHHQDNSKYAADVENRRQALLKRSRERRAA